MSTRSSWRPPSLAFGFLVLSWGLLAGFLAWGFATPKLDDTWRVVQRMRQGDFDGLEPAELETLSAALRGHPGLSRALADRSPVGLVEPTTDGWSTLAVSHALVQPVPGSSIRVTVASRGDAKAFPLTVKFQGAGIDRTLRFDYPRQMDFVLPQGQPRAPALVTVTLTAASSAPKSHLPTQISVDGQLLAPGKASP